MEPSQEQTSRPSPKGTVRIVNLTFIALIVLLIPFDGGEFLGGIVIVSVLLELYNLAGLIYYSIKKNEAFYVSLNFLMIVAGVGILSALAWFALHFTKMGG